MRFVIQDSDDDVDNDSCRSPPANRNTLSPCKDISTREDQLPSQRGATFSGEKDAPAHEPIDVASLTFSPAKMSEPISPINQRLKRRNTMADTLLRSSPNTKLERRKTLKTYGQTKHKYDNLDQFNATSERLKEPGNIQDSGAKNIKSPEKSSGNDTASFGSLVARSLESAEKWEISASLRDDFAQHEPNVMFPTSSTVLNTTQTQKYISDAIAAGNSAPVLDIAIPGSNNSFSFSQYLATQTTSQPQPENHDISYGLSPVVELDEGASTHYSSLNTKKQVVAESHTSYPQTIQEKSVHELPVAFASLSQIAPVKVGTRPRIDPANDLYSDELAIGLPKELYKPRPSRSRSAQVIPQDDGSTSIKATDSKKSKIQRRKTTNHGEGSLAKISQTHLETVQDIDPQVIPEQGVENRISGTLQGPSTNKNSISTQVSLEDEIADVKTAARPQLFSSENQRDETRPVDTTSIEQENSDPSKTKKRKRGRPKTVSNDELQSCRLATETDTHKVEPPREAPKGSDLEPIGMAQSVIEASARNEVVQHVDRNQIEELNKKNSKVKRRKTAPTTVSDADGVVDEDLQDENPIVEKTKRSRGRPRSIQKAIQTSNVIPSARKVQRVEDKPQNEDRKTPEGEPLQNVDPNLNHVEARLTKFVGEVPPSTPPTTKEKDSRIDEDNRSSTVTMKGKGETSSSPTNHSPLNKGKVPYRVGLSRRARIPSLLRVHKK
ncbi:hypothetical protein M501DRAFT_1013621 [Patellaria atrata CBS 101060]|uniref:Uncharacterized protein n=1 Tax=Patellaria atrata CBS 101060 TaxID=1346257 RepID=A0A9P4SIM1_9PEZI|nr:hypothetical protein M501DRAFT_1013621 [Patellaria atrata CBS 101060]